MFISLVVHILIRRFITCFMECTTYYNYFVYIYPCSIMIRGSPSDSAVVCTNDKTYELKLVETSNALLLAPRLLTPQDSGTSVLCPLLHLLIKDLSSC